MKTAMMTGDITRFGDIEFALRLIKELGFEAADLTMFDVEGFWLRNKELFNGDIYANARRIKKIAEEINLPIVQAHTPFHVYVKGDEKYNAEMLETQKMCIEIAGIIGIAHVVIHPVMNADDEFNKKFFDKLLPLAKKNNVIITTENMWEWQKGAPHCDYTTCSTPESFLRLLEHINHPNLKACVDVGHAQMFNSFDQSISPKKMIEKLGKKYCVALHLHDNDGVHDLHKVPFEGVINWDEIYEGLVNINYEENLITETLCPHDYTFEDCKALWIRQRAAVDTIKAEILRRKALRS